MREGPTPEDRRRPLMLTRDGGPRSDRRLLGLRVLLHGRAAAWDELLVAGGAAVEVRGSVRDLLEDAGRFDLVALDLEGGGGSVGLLRQLRERYGPRLLTLVALRVARDGAAIAVGADEVIDPGESGPVIAQRLAVLFELRRARAAAGRLRANWRAAAGERLLLRVDGQGRVIEIAGPWTQLLGLPESAVVERPAAAVVHPRDVLATDFTPGPSRSLARRLRTGDGGWRWFRLQIDPVPGDRRGGDLHVTATPIVADEGASRPPPSRPPSATSWPPAARARPAPAPGGAPDRPTGPIRLTRPIRPPWSEDGG